MPILLISKQGQQIMVKGESSAEFFERQKGGLIPVEWLDGHLGHVQKDSTWATKVIPLEEHNKAVEEHKKAEEEKKAAEAKRLTDLAAAKEQAKAQVKLDNEAAAAARAKAIEDARFVNRVKRFLRIR